VQCGTATSVLLGDTLFAHALLLAAGFPTPDVCRAVAAATKVVCTGEIIQTQGSTRLDMTREEYFRILRMKTAELFALSCELGARFAGGGPEEQQALRDYGVALGTAYQIYDDCVDLFGDEVRAGKSLGTDLLGGKLTLPLLVGLERAQGAERRRLERILTHWKPELLEDLRALLRQTDALAESTAVIANYCRLARESVDDLPPSAGRRALARATEFLARQTETLATSAGGWPPVTGATDSATEAAEEGHLVARARAGDLEAYDTLVRQHQERVYATIYHMTSNHEDAADLTQETFVRAFRALGTFKGDSSFYTWIYRIAVNKTINHLKQRKHRGHISLNDLDLNAEHDPDLVALVSDRTPRRDANLRELQERLNVAMQRLSEEHRMVVTLHDIQGLKHEEIAAIMKCNVGTVRSRLFYARQQLQAYLGEWMK
jgi:RNA polymerase sigma factor (sigma-70 family)